MSLLEFFKDMVASDAHATTALGNDERRKVKPVISAITPKAKVEGNVAKFENFSIAKVDADLGLVFGFAIVCKREGENYFDLQGDHITEAAMLKAASDFMVNSRISKDMHEGEADGTVVFAFPLTTEIAKALDITTQQTGLLIAMRPSADVLAKFKAGDYTGFSIGGARIEDEEVA